MISRIILVAFFIFPGCEQPEELYSLSEDPLEEAEEEGYAPAKKYYSDRSGRPYRRRSGGSGGGGSTGGGGGGSSLSVSVCDRDRAVQSAIICELMKNGRLSGSCNDINSNLMSSRCNSVEQSDLDSIEELRITDDFEISSRDFSDLSSLLSLHLSGNDIESLSSSTFSDLTRLELLNLSRNSLSNLPSSIFSSLSRLEVLDLSDNELESPLNNFYSGLNNLEELDLSGNNDISSSDEARIRQAFSGNTGIDIIFD